MSTVRWPSDLVLAGRYRVQGFHGAGGMQDVYRCHDIALSRDIVVKTPQAGVKDRRFRRGAEMGARVNHPNIAATFDYYEDDNLTFLVEEYIPGTDLSYRLSQDFDYMDPALAAHVIHHIARALTEAHRVGICHRDLKPSNIMVSSNPGLTDIKLTDFGIAKLAESEIGAELQLFEKDESTLTSSSTLLGAVPYLAPECWESWKDAGQPMDVWALGCVAYQLLAGKPPFGTGRPAIAKVVKLQSGAEVIDPIKWLGKHKSTEALETELFALIKSCIQVDPAKRPSAAQIVSSCDEMCYAAAPRRSGTVGNFGATYAGGGKGNFGHITDDVNHQSWFFHETEFFGDQRPVAGQRVNFSVYPGVPRPRSSPVLLLKAAVTATGATL